MRWVSFDEIIEPLGDLYDKAAEKDDAFSAGECSGIWNAMQMIGKFADEAGRWILHDKGDGSPWWECSICHRDGRGDYKFCPYCGTRMEVNNEVN